MAKGKTGQENKFQYIIRDMKAQILAGKLMPEGRIPTRVELERKYKASSRTIQKSLDVLIYEGFIRVRGRKGGSFISPRPPCQSRFALLFPQKHEYWAGRNMFYQSLYNQSRLISEKHDIAFELFHGFSNLRNFDTFLKLTEDLIACKFAGVIFASPPFQLEGSQLLEHPGILRAGVMSRELFTNIPKVAPGDRFLEKAMGRLALMNCRRPFLLSAAGAGVAGNFQKFCLKFGMNYDERRIQAANRDEAQWANHMVQAVMSLPSTCRPDGMIIADDLLEPHAVKGLTARGISKSKHFPIVSLCNYPLIQPCELDVIHLGYDTDRYLELLVKLIKDQRLGKTVPAFTALPALFEDEHMPASPADKDRYVLSVSTAASQRRRKHVPS
ncbi:MAG: GntR family transcriptional regulator [Victivallales bacterium]